VDRWRRHCRASDNGSEWIPHFAIVRLHEGRIMREIAADTIIATVARLCIEAAHLLPDDVLAALERAKGHERSPLGLQVLDTIIENAEVARTRMIPLCQDTGVTVVMLELGQDAHVTGGYLYDAIAEGVRRGYRDGYLRASIVERPFSARENTKDNTPPVIHTEIVPGDRLHIRVMPKGFGCENMSRFAMLLPGAGRAGITDFVLQTVDEAGGNPCPPIIVGVGIGGSADYAMWLAKKSLTRRVGSVHPDPETAGFEAELLEKVNALGLGPQAVGGLVTALAVHIETFPTHIASLPVAVNLQCHSARLKEAEV
jgi:fumarate hydratase subunit alpha